MLAHPHIMLIADDFGYNTPVSMGILALCQQGVLDGVSCMTTMPAFRRHVATLKPLRDTVKIGLHINFTDGPDAYRLSTLITKSYCKQLDDNLINTRIKEQLAIFTDTFGKQPDFIDGHQHVHHLPMIRDCLLGLYENSLLNNTCLIRIAAQPDLLDTLKSAAPLKSLIIRWTGAVALRKACVQRNIAHNSSFSGVYGFDDQRAYEDYFKTFIKASTPGGIIMCHPGIASDDKDDAIRDARVREFNFFQH